MDDNDLPSKGIEKLIELWQQEECLWIISLEGYYKKDLKGNQLTGSERLLTINTQVPYMHNFCRKEQQVMVKLHTKVSSSVQ